MRKYKVAFYIALFYALTSCGLLQRNTTTSTEDRQDLSGKVDMVTAAAQEKNMESQSFTFYTDSTQHGYSIQLWPKGHFTYSPLNGFEGEAEKVLVTGNLNGVKKGNGTTVLKANESERTELKLKTSEKGKAVQKATAKEKVPSAWWVFGGLVLLAGMLMYFLRLKF